MRARPSTCLPAAFASLIAAYASGFYSPGAIANHPDSVLDAVPADVAAGLVLAAGLALAAGIRSKQQLHAAAAAAGAAGAAANGAAPGSHGSVRMAGRPAAMDLAGRYVGGGARADDCRHGSGDGGGRGEIMVFHAATSASRPLPFICFYDRMHRFFAAHRPRPAWPLPGLGPHR